MFNDKTDRDERDDELDEDEGTEPTYQFASKSGGKSSGGKSASKGRAKSAAKDDEDAGAGDDEEMDEGDDFDEGDDGGDALDEGDDGEAYDESSSADDLEDDDSDGPAEGESKNGGKGSRGRKSLMGASASAKSRAPREMPGATRAQGGKMSERETRGEGRQLSEREVARLFAEQKQLREEVARLRFSEYQHKTEDILAGWGKQRFQFSEGMRKDGTTVQGRGSIALSKVFRDAYRAFMLSESGLKLSEKDRAGVNRLVEIALSSAIVDLSERGSSYDQEARKTIRRGGPNGGIGGEASVDRLQQTAESIALSEHGKAVEFLTPEQILDVYRRAEKEAEYK